MRRVTRKNVRPHDQQADRADHLLRLGQCCSIGRDPLGMIGVIKANIGVIYGRSRFDFGIFNARRIAVDHKPHQRFNVLVRTAQPVLHTKEICADVLRLAGNKLQDFRQAAQHFHLLFAAGVFRFAGAAQLFQQAQNARRRLAHIQIAEPCQRDHFTGRNAREHRIALIAARFEVREDRRDMLFEENQIHENHIGGGNRRLCLDEQFRIFRPHRRRMDRHCQARKDTGQLRLHTLCWTRRM